MSSMGVALTEYADVNERRRVLFGECWFRSAHFGRKGARITTPPQVRSGRLW